MASIKDVARQAGVSIATVSHVINGTRYVSEETQMKVRAAMEELDFQLNSVARSLRSRKSHMIGLLVPILEGDTSNFFFMSIAQGIERVLRQNGYNLIVSNSQEDKKTELEQVRLLSSQRIDGLIIAPAYDPEGQAAAWSFPDFPVVFIDRIPEGGGGDSILADSLSGTYEAVRELVRQGHRRIGYLSAAPGITTGRERLEGYRRGLASCGLEAAPEWIRLAPQNKASLAMGSRLTAELLDAEPAQRVTAVVIASNIMTMGALECLQERGLSIPRDMAVIGFDDYPWARVTTPPLTVVKQPSFELGEAAAELLLGRIRNPKLPLREVRLPTELVRRGSHGPAEGMQIESNHRKE